MADPTRPSLGSGARGVISGFISNGSTWYENIEITENDTVISGADTWTWQLNFREDGGESVVLSLSTTDATLVISQGTSATTVQIRVAADSLSALEGDYIADLASKDGSNRIIHWAHGIVTFINEPVWSS